MAVCISKTLHACRWQRLSIYVTHIFGWAQSERHVKINRISNFVCTLYDATRARQIKRYPLIKTWTEVVCMKRFLFHSVMQIYYFNFVFKIGSFLYFSTSLVWILNNIWRKITKMLFLSFYKRNKRIRSIINSIIYEVFPLTCMVSLVYFSVLNWKICCDIFVTSIIIARSINFVQRWMC